MLPNIIADLESHHESPPCVLQSSSAEKGHFHFRRYLPSRFCCGLESKLLWSGNSWCYGDHIFSNSCLQYRGHRLPWRLDQMKMMIEWCWIPDHWCLLGHIGNLSLTFLPCMMTANVSDVKFGWVHQATLHRLILKYFVLESGCVVFEVLENHETSSFIQSVELEYLSRCLLEEKQVVLLGSQLPRTALPSPSQYRASMYLSGTAERVS